MKIEYCELISVLIDFTYRRECELGAVLL